MSRRLFPQLTLVLSLLLASCTEYQDKDSYYKLKNEGPAFDLSILTFNILSSLDLISVSEGYPVWGQRRAAVLSFIEDSNADVVSLQESAITQADQFRASMSHRYELIENIAYTPDVLLFVKKGMFRIIEKGFWLLEDIENVKSIRRLALWAKLRHEESGRDLMVITAHLDANDTKKQRETARILSKISQDQASGAPLFLFGDFNMTLTDREFAPLLEAGWKDSFSGDSEVFTFPTRNLQRRIDHVLSFGPAITATSWKAREVEGDDVLLSDHKPVLVDFSIEESTP